MFNLNIYVRILIMCQILLVKLQFPSREVYIRFLPNRVTSGVPQSASFSPLLFDLFTNVLASTLVSAKQVQLINKAQE